jgi:23S rRNA (uracil1939-C5)-methyltransferase
MARAGSAPPAAQEQTLELVEMGTRGDAVAAGESGPIYVAYGLPGETVRAAVIGERGRLLSIERASQERVGAPCSHVGVCGGCQLQHWDDQATLSWKRQQVVAALAKRGLEAQVDETIAAWGAGRRRIGLHVARDGRDVRFGFVERGTARISPISMCPAMTPGLAAKLGALKTLALGYAPQRGEAILQVLETETGLDVDIKGAGGAEAFDRSGFVAAAQAAEVADVARLSIAGEVLVERRTPVLSMGLARVRPPPGCFTQPTVLGEETLVALTLAAIGEGPKRVADLFCGVGTFALRLAQTAEVWAVDGEAAMLAALKAGGDGAGGAIKTITTTRRDLLRQPVAGLEMKKIDAVVFDPPRCGARLQAEQIAASGASRVAAVSCDPATFARDARVLVDAGFTLSRVSPVDQFHWSAHVEVVGAFER